MPSSNDHIAPELIILASLRLLTACSEWCNWWHHHWESIFIAAFNITNLHYSLL